MVSIEPASNTESALSTLVEERARTDAEKRAFASFRTRVADVECERSVGRDSEMMCPTTDGGTVFRTVNRKQSCAPLIDTVVTAYRETVMAVDHYDEEFDETLCESLAEELTDDIAVALTCGDEFSPALQRTVCKAAETARQDRSSFLTELATENESLTCARDRLQDIASTYESLTADHPMTLTVPELSDRYAALRNLLERCEDLATARQVTLQECRPRHEHDDVSLQSYLYQSLSTNYPVLADCATLSDSIRPECRRLLRELTER